MAATPEFGVDVRIRQMIDHLPDAVLMFDTDLRLLLAGGRPLTSNGFQPIDMVGRTLDEILPSEAYRQLIEPYRSALTGTPSDFVISSEIVGGRFHVRIEPLRDDAGAVVGALSVTTDVALQEGLEFELDRARRLLSFGSAAYGRLTGWVIDQALMDLWGLDDIAEPNDVISSVVLPEDREKVVASWERVARSGGRSEIDYRIVHGRTGLVRHMHGTTEVVLGVDGAILRAMTTQIDITGVIDARIAADRARVDLASNRALVMRYLRDSAALSADSLDGAAQAIADIGAAAIGDQCLVRVLDGEGRRVESYAAAFRDSSLIDASRQWLDVMPPDVSALSPEVRQAISTKEVVAGQDHQIDADEPNWTKGSHYLVAPIRRGDQVLGSMSLGRPGSEPAYSSEDADMAQILADSLGLQIHTARTSAEREEESALRRTLDDQLQLVMADQRDLVLQLDRTESRERMQLAEAVHDQPLQLVVAAMLRLDNLRDRIPEAERILVEDVAGNLETAVEQLRSVIVTLTPPDLGRGLGPALRSLAESTFVGTATQVRVVGPDHVRLDPKTKVSVYRILREALINARKHAAASHVTIEIVDDSQTVVIRLADDGVGMSHAVSGPGHLGLASMRARAEAAHAHLALTSPLTGGTVVELTLRVHSAAEDEDEAAAERELETERPSTMERRLT